MLNVHISSFFLIYRTWTNLQTCWKKHFDLHSIVIACLLKVFLCTMILDALTQLQIEENSKKKFYMKKIYLQSRKNRIIPFAIRKSSTKLCKLYEKRSFSFIQSMFPITLFVNKKTCIILTIVQFNHVLEICSGILKFNYLSLPFRMKMTKTCIFHNVVWQPLQRLFLHLILMAEMESFEILKIQLLSYRKIRIFI